MNVVLKQVLTWEQGSQLDLVHCSPACNSDENLQQAERQEQKQLHACMGYGNLKKVNIWQWMEATHFWLGRFTGFGAVTLPKETIRRPGLQKSQ